jgi:hypothetical protein
MGMAWTPRLRPPATGQAAGQQKKPVAGARACSHNNELVEKWGLAPAKPSKTLKLPAPGRCLSPFFHQLNAVGVSMVQVAYAGRRVPSTDTLPPGEVLKARSTRITGFTRIILITLVSQVQRKNGCFQECFRAGPGRASDRLNVVISNLQMTYC